ncbi:MAG: hypothetical protein KGS60_04780 [Verrucomicrobia bacterium]|jgi:hypothetical protein|nr:hypothetical protein [Verrucomicrobiota bacterium]
MPYTFHLAETRSEASQSEALLSLDYRLHRAIFEEPPETLHDLTLFYNLSDFYQDASFVDGQILGLRVEVEKARQRIHHPQATAAVSELGKLCDLAVAKRLNLFAFGE